MYANHLISEEIADKFSDHSNVINTADLIIQYAPA